MGFILPAAQSTLGLEVPCAFVRTDPSSRTRAHYLRFVFLYGNSPALAAAWQEPSPSSCAFPS